MTRINNRLWLISMIALLAITSACKKGDVGPEGPQGIQGEQGEQGEKGDKGDKGNTGNANVKSRIFTAAQISWKNTTLFGTNYVIASLTVPEIDADIVNNGMVMVYGGFFWGEPWSAIPLSYYESGRTVNFSFGVKSGSATLRMHYSTNAQPTAPGIQFKVVVIKGQAAVSAKNHNILMTDYTQVSKFFHLE